MSLLVIQMRPSTTALCIPTQKTEAVLKGLIHSSDDLKQASNDFYCAITAHRLSRVPEYSTEAQMSI